MVSRNLNVVGGYEEANPSLSKIPHKYECVAIDGSLSLKPACFNVFAGIRQSQRVLREFFSRVSTSIQPSLDRFAGELLSENLVTSEVVHDLAETIGVPPDKQSNKLLCAVQKKIDCAKSDRPFKSLCRVMKKFSVLEDLESEMTKRFGKCLLC